MLHIEQAIALYCGGPGSGIYVHVSHKGVVTEHSKENLPSLARKFGEAHAFANDRGDVQVLKRGDAGAADDVVKMKVRDYLRSKGLL